ncbi:translation initiation factor IF-2 [Ruminococcus sp.]|uniref:translation initiation factor IF-2 n=1 Tax=Ruminococcus sp. TaxID=41978 RepID=UPI003FD88F75
MSMKTTKYKLSEMAKDLKVTNNELIECLGKLGGEPKKTQSVLTPEEISYVLEYYTQNNQVDSFDAFYANNVKPVKEEKPAKEEKKAAKKPAKTEKQEKKAEPKAEKKPEPKAAPKAETKPEPKAEPKVEKKPEVKAETKQPAPEQKKKQPEQQKPAKKKEHGVRQQLGGFSDKKENTGGYTISEDNDSFGTQRTIDTRGSYIELDKYNEKYDNLANSKQNKSKDNFTKKQKLTQKSQQRKKQQFSHKKETESEKLRRLELERARKQQLKVMIPDEIVVSELASRLKVTATQVIKKLMGLGVMASINEVVDFDTAALVAEELGAKVEKEVHVTIEERLIETDEDPEESLQERCPVVVVMGHVDHGKTSILDRIRNAHVTDTEAGGITQHIGAYQVEYQGKKITFLDTPGHEAFTAMRARGANVTDIAILVVAADDGIMPQTIESINHAKAAGVSIIVAINKMDKEGADPERVKQQLTEQSLVVEEWGGDVIAVPVSAKTGMGIDELLENILLVAEVKELKANPDRLARGTVVEARLDKGKGPVATLLVQNGTLKSGDVIIAGTSVGRIRTMTNDKGRSIKEAGPSTPVEITGLGEVPSAGDVFNAVADEKLARELVEQRKHEAKEELFQQHQKVTLDNLFSQIAEGEMKELPIIVKADVQGSVEAVKQSLEKLSNDEVRVKVIHGGVGAVSESDVMLANASNAIIVGFNVRPDPVAKQNAEQSGVDIRLYRIIYDAIEEITDAMKGMLAPKYREVETARIEVRQVYKISNVGTVAGSYVLDGKVGRNNEIRVVRDGIVVAEDKMSSLKRFKDDAKEVAAGFECGITLEKFTDIKEGDIFEAFYMEEYRD